MKNITIFLIAFFTVAFVLFMGEAGKMKREQHDYQGYSKPRVNLEEVK